MDDRNCHISPFKCSVLINLELFFHLLKKNSFTLFQIQIFRRNLMVFFFLFNLFYLRVKLSRLIIHGFGYPIPYPNRKE
jgi:hypothetical protein